MLPGCIILSYTLTLEKLNLLSQSSELQFKSSLKIKFKWFPVGRVNVTFLSWEMYLEKFNWENEIAFSEDSSETETQTSWSGSEDPTALLSGISVLCFILANILCLQTVIYKEVLRKDCAVAFSQWQPPHDKNSLSLTWGFQDTLYYSNILQNHVDGGMRHF